MSDALDPETTEPSHGTAGGETRPTLGAFGAVLLQPTALQPAGRLLLGALGCWVLYGAVAGFFQGGGQILVSALKAPLILALALLLCLPSFVVFHLVAGVERTLAAFLRLVAGFAAVLGLMLAALAPVAWLFSVSTRSLAALVVLHTALWGAAVLFGLRYLRSAVGTVKVAWLWLFVFTLVTLQLATYLGPVLVRREGGDLFELRRGSFLSRFGEVADTPPLSEEPRR